MTTQTGTEASEWTTKTKALAAALMLTAVMAVSILVPVPAEASAFPGANGKIVFSSSRTTGTGVSNPEGDFEIFAMNPDGTGFKQLTKNTANDLDPSYSADGNKIVFASQRTGNFDVFAMNADGTAQKNLSGNPARDLNPSFSPNGQKVVFQRDISANNVDVFVMNADGTGQTALTSDPLRDEDPTFSPKGDKIAFVSDRGARSSDVFVMNSDGTQQTNLTQKPDFPDQDPSFSPDGSKIAFASNRAGQGDFDDFDVFVMNADGSNPTALTFSRAKDTRPAYSPDGQKIAFASTRDGGDADVFAMEASGANQTDITLDTTTDDAPDWQPVAKTFTVTTASDTGDGACGGTCTLREAIGASNAVLGQLPNTIKFNIPGGGVQTITPTSNLPAITRPVLIDGYTQPGASPNTLATGTNAALKIELNGTNAPFGFGLSLFDTSNSVIRGLVINRFAGSEIAINSANNNRVEGNFIGTNPTGTLDSPIKGLGLNVDNAIGNTIGGTTPAARNLISGNDEGMEFLSSSQGNRVLGNLVGTTASGTAPLGNTDWGVAMFGTFISDNEIGNGTAAGANTIAFNGKDGIEIDNLDSATGNTISRNSVFSNGGLGIDLIGGTETDDTNISTPNDAGDADAGANNLQNKPVITSAKTSSTKTTITGKLNSTPGKTFKIQLFSSPSGQNEGKRFVGQKSITTDGSGNATFTFSPASKVAVGQAITATATKTSTGDTSEFSAPRRVATS